MSAKTVSRVVNGEPHVSARLNERVRAAIDRLGYRPDRRARDLAMGPNSRLIGFVLADEANPFFAAVARGLDDVARAAGFLVISGSTDGEPGRESELINTLIELRVDGLVVASAEGNDELLRREIDHGTAVVCVDRVLPGLPADNVITDNRTAIGRAVRHLWGDGHRRIAYLGGNPAVWTARERHTGWREAMARATGSPVDERLVVLDVGSVAGAEAATRRLFSGRRSRWPTAVVTGQDRITMGTVKALQDLDLDHDVALIGFDDLPFAELFNPPIAAIAQDPLEMGRTAGRRLLARLAGLDEPPTTLVVPTDLRARRSASIPPADR